LGEGREEVPWRAMKTRGVEASRSDIVGCGRGCIYVLVGGDRIVEELMVLVVLELEKRD